MLENSDLIKSFFGSLVTYFTWLFGKNIQTKLPDLQDLSFMVAIVAGLLTAMITVLKIIDWFENRKIKRLKNLLHDED